MAAKRLEHVPTNPLRTLSDQQLDSAWSRRMRVLFESPLADDLRAIKPRPGERSCPGAAHHFCRTGSGKNKKRPLSGPFSYVAER